MPHALLTDQYELTMAASYLRRGMNETATFSLFVRDLPPQRGFLVACGLEECLEYLTHLSFSQEDLSWLAEQGWLTERDLLSLRDLRFTGDVWAVPEGRVIGPQTPLIEVTAPLPEAQIVETFLLNAVTFATAVGTKAARCTIAAQGRTCVEFGMRRTQGIGASIRAARSCAIAGFDSTSNVEAARRFGLQATGTMAHSYVEAFPSEADAFRAFATDFPGRTTFLVDTYDTLEGVRTAISVIRELGLRDNLAVRLDSGDLSELSRASRRILDEAGLEHVRIFASGGLDEFTIDELVSGGAPIDGFGIGTRIGTSADAPYLDSAYKMVAYAGRGVMKRSLGKASMPGAKQVFRTSDGDVIGLRSEKLPGEPLLVQVMRGGQRRFEAEPLTQARDRFTSDLDRLPTGAPGIRDPQPLTCQVSEELQRFTAETSRSR